jgi:hypothetical protein
MNQNQNNPIPFILDALTKKAVNSDSSSVYNQEKMDKAMEVCQDLIAVFEKHNIGPVEAYSMTGALSDAIYLYLMNLSKRG